jgi:hypothetical protein
MLMAINEIGEIVPPISASDELTTVETAYGPMEKWKARALSVGWMQRTINSVRSDAAVERNDVGPPKTPLTDEQKAPPLAADVNCGSDHPTREDETQPHQPALDPAVLDAIERKVDEIAARMDRFEAAQHAAAVLDALEAQIEQEHPPTANDVAGLTMQ